MSEERPAASVPDSADAGAPPELAAQPAIEADGSTSADAMDGGAAVRRRARTLRIPDDDVSRPVDRSDAPPGGERRPSDRPAANRTPSMSREASPNMCPSAMTGRDPLGCRFG